jgi:tetratricopeptide (TPR) repeat protein
MKSRIPTPTTFLEGKAFLLLCCAGLALMVWIVFGKSVQFGFLNFDDDLFVTKNARILQGISWTNLQWAWTAGLDASDHNTDYWRPLSLISQMADVQFFGLKAGWHHAVNLAIHTINTVILFLVLRSMTGAPVRSAFVAALFAIHPLHVESVAWVSERKDLLCGFFFLLTIGAYTRYARERFRWGNYILVLLLYSLGLLSKPMAVTLPFVLLLLDYWPLQRTESVCRSRLLLEKVPFFAMALAVAGITTLGWGGVNLGAMAGLPLPWRLGNAVVAYATYLFQMAWPRGLTVFYIHPARNLSLWSVGLALALLTAITWIVIWQRRRRYLTVGWFWYLGMLIPVIGITQSGAQAHADRFTYLPLIGIFLALTWLAADLSSSFKVPTPLTGFLASLLLVMLMLVAGHQVSFWRTDLDLWAQCLSLNHSNPIALNNMGLALSRVGRDDEAMALFQEACRLEPDYSTARLNIAMEKMRHGNSPEASSELLKIIRNNPRDETAYYNLSILSQQEGRKSDAMTSLRDALKINPSFGEASLSLAALLIESGSPDEAVAVLRSSLQYHPDEAKAHAYLGEAFSRQGRWQESLVEYGRALSLKPDNPESLAGLGSSLLATGRVMEAVPPLSRATQLNPELADAHNNLGIALIRTDRRNEAVKEFERAIRLDPANPDFLRNLNNARGAASDHPTDHVIK